MFILSENSEELINLNHVVYFNICDWRKKGMFTVEAELTDGASRAMITCPTKEKAKQILHSYMKLCNNATNKG